MAQKRYNYILRHGDGASSDGSNTRVQAQSQQQSTVKKPKQKEPGLRIYDGNLDILFFAIVIVLLVYGIIMMFSASYIAGLNSRAHDGYMYVRTQGIAAVAGVILMIFISFFDYHILMNTKIVFIGVITATVMMLLVFSPIGHAEANAYRWIELGSWSFQPSEMMKAVLIVFMSYLAVRHQNHYDNFRKGIMPMVVVLGFVCGLMVLQRHISGLLLMAAIGFCIMFVSGIPFKQLVRAGVILLAAAIIAVILASALGLVDLSYVFDRFTSMSEADSGEMTDESWQTTQSLIAIGSGGWFGLGFGESRQKYSWLPEPYNDFIFPIIVEELGFLGGIVVVILFGLFIYRGFYIAKKAPDKFGMLVATGITFQIGIQALLNIGVACNAFPNTGIALPFFSSGGTALLMQLAEMGVLLGISRQCEI